MKVMLDKQKLRAARRAKGLSQERLAELLDISDRHMRNIENHDVDIHAGLLYRLSRELGTTMNELMKIE